MIAPKRGFPKPAQAEKRLEQLVCVGPCPLRGYANGQGLDVRR